MITADAIIFDFGDTIAILNPPKEDIVSEFFSSKGIYISPQHIRNAYRIVDYCYKQSALRHKDQKEKKNFLITMNCEIFKVLGLSLKSALWAEELFEYFKAKKRWELFPDTLALLRKLHELGYRTAILANWDKGLNSLARSLDIEQYFSHILCSEELSIEKPNPEIFHYMVKLMSVKPNNTLYIGNEYETDVTGARNARLIPVLIDRNNFWPHADCLRFESLNGLMNYLEGS